MAVIILDQVTKEELITEVAGRLVIELNKILVQTKAEDLNKKEWLTSKEVLQTLKISHTTLWNWSKKGIIKSHKISGRLRYNYNEILQAIKRKEYNAM